MAGGTEGVTIEKVWDDVELFVVYKIPSGYSGKVLMVYEDPFEAHMRVVTEEEYTLAVADLLFTVKPKQEEQSDG